MAAFQRKGQRRGDKVNHQKREEVNQQLLKARRAGRRRMKVLVPPVLQRACRKHDVNKGRDQRQQNLENNNIWQCKQAHRAIRAEGVLVLEDSLQDPERPAEALPHQTIDRRGRFSKCQRAVFINDLVILLQQVHRQVRIFRYRIDGISSTLDHRCCAPGSDCTWNDCDYVEQVQRPALKVLAGDVLERLPARKQVHLVADLCVSGNRAHSPVRKMHNQLFYRVSGNDRISINTDVKFFLNVLQAKIQRLCLARIWLRQDQQPALSNLLRISLTNNVKRPVSRPVINHNNVQVVIRRVQHRAHCADDDLLLVISRNQHSHTWREVCRAMYFALTHAVNQRKDANQHETRAHQHVARKKHKDDEVAEEPINQKRNGINPRLPAKVRSNRRHHLRRGLAHQL